MTRLTCWCPRHRPPARLAAFAPRLARARDDLIATLVRERHERKWLRDRVLDAERVVAHRELQLLRGRRGRYLRGRHRLLAEARRELDTYTRLLAEAETNATVVGPQTYEREAA